MNFLAPGAFFLGLLLPVIVAMYLLRLRRIEREVSSTFLWRKMVRDVEANAPWQKLRANLLMILQLLFLAALIFALARPFQWAEGAGGEAAIIVLDTSASMAATDVAPNRIESAKQRARQLVDELPGTSRVTIIEAGREARVLLSSSLDRRLAHLAIEQVQAGSGGSDMAISLELASAIASRQPGTEIIVLSDGNVELPQRITIRGTLRYIPFGLSGENTAVSLITLQPTPGGASLTAFVQVTNYGAEPSSPSLSLWADGQIINNVQMEAIPPGGQRNLIEEGLPPETAMVEAVLLSAAGADNLPLDDHAVAIRPQSEPIPVTLVTQGNRFIETALGLLPGVALTQQDPETLLGTGSETPAPAQAQPAGDPPALIIYDNTIPDTLPTTGSLLFIAPPRSTDYFTTTGTVDTPRPRIVDSSDPLVQNLSLSEVSILDAVQIPLPDWAVPVVSGELSDGTNTPLLMRGEVNGQRIAVLAFDFRRSDLQLQVAFPLLWANMIDWLAPGAGSAVPEQVAPGETLIFNAPEGAQSAAITRPDGSTVQVQAQNGRFAFADTTQLGAYRLQFQPAEPDNPQEAAFAVNLFAPQESSLEPAANLPNLQGDSETAAGGALRSMREWWRPLALLALGLLVGEWLVYQRAALSRLRDGMLGAFNTGVLPVRKGKR